MLAKLLVSEGDRGSKMSGEMSRDIFTHDRPRSCERYGYLRGMKRKKRRTIAAKSASRLEDEDTGRREAKDRVSYQLFLHLFIGRATTPSYHRRCCFPSFPLDSKSRRHSFSLSPPLSFPPSFLPFLLRPNLTLCKIISTKGDENSFLPFFFPSFSPSSSSFILFVNFFW